MFFVVRMGGLEPPTSSLSGMRSNQLSYMRKVILNYIQNYKIRNSNIYLVGSRGLEPLTSTMST